MFCGKIIYVISQTPAGITDLSAEITQLKRSMTVPHMHPFDPDFEDSPALCSTCARVVSKLSAFPCHNCGFFVCERCLEKARQCPKCLMGSIDDYSCSDHAPREAHSHPPDPLALGGVQQRHGAAEGEPLYHVLEGGGGGGGGEFDSDSSSATDEVGEENIYQALEDFERPEVVGNRVQEEEEEEEEEEGEVLFNGDSDLERRASEDGDREFTRRQKREDYAVIGNPILKRSGALEGNHVEERGSNHEQTSENGSQVVGDDKPPLEEMSRIARLRHHFESNGK